MLTRGGATCTVLERDTAVDNRSQGGSLDLHPESGQAALAEAALTDAFWSLARTQGEELRILGPDGIEHHHHRSSGGQRPEIDRADLRELLLRSLPKGTVRWRSRVEAVHPGMSGGHTLSLEGCAPVHVDVLVGADGARSRVRPLLTDVEPLDAGIRYAELWLHDLHRDHPELEALVGLDGAELGRLLLAHPDDPPRAIAVFEREMHQRVQPIHEESDRIQAAILSPDALATMTRMFGGS